MAQTLLGTHLQSPPMRRTLSVLANLALHHLVRRPSLSHARVRIAQYQTAIVCATFNSHLSHWHPFRVVCRRTVAGDPFAMDAETATIEELSLRAQELSIEHALSTSTAATASQFSVHLVD
jgi:hypothetical protein